MTSPLKIFKNNPVTLVQNQEQIIDNIWALEGYRQPSDPESIEYHGGLLSRGVCFVAYEKDGRQCFGPSRFIGYQNNSKERHDANERGDGRRTTRAIEGILKKKFLTDTSLEEQYRQFCKWNSIKTAQRPRKFINLSILDYDAIAGDIREIQKSSTIQETEKEQLVLARMGQGSFRKGLERYWKGCSVTGCSQFRMLRASHIKPWRSSSNLERLDPFNGLLLVPNLDQGFDQGLISFNDRGEIIISALLSKADALKLGITSGMKVHLARKHLPYLKFHRKDVFRSM